MGKTDLSKIAYDYLFERIVANSFTPGTSIVENEICELLNISRTPVREAIRRLQAEGLVNKIKDIGTMVREITHDDIIEIFEIRILFEVFALKPCIENIKDEEIRSLEQRLLKLDASSDPQEYYEVDRDIHNAIMKFCSNSRMVNYLKTLNAQSEKFRRVSATTPKRLSKSREEHLAIVQAICNRDYEKAHEELTHHLNEVRRSVIEAYRSFKVIKG